MRRVHRPLLVLHPDAAFRARVEEACGDDFGFEPLESWAELEKAISEGPPSALVLADPFTVGGAAGAADADTPSDRFRELLRGYPSTPMIAAFELRPQGQDAVRTLARWGVVQVIAIGHDDTVPAIRRRLQGARGRAMRALLERVLPPETSGRARVIIDAAAEVVTLGGHGRDLASKLNLSRRTLLRWSERAGLPPPRRLLAWMRVLLACSLLDDPGRTVASVARSAGYASDSGLRRVTQNFLDASPTDLRERGALASAASAFVSALNEQRLKTRIVTREG